jgi:hypothetical protein
VLPVGWWVRIGGRYHGFTEAAASGYLAAFGFLDGITA